MGRIKPTLIKRTSKKLFDSHKDRFKKDFNDNKGIVEELLEIQSKKFRNVIAGYITKLVKQQRS